MKSKEASKNKGKLNKFGELPDWVLLLIIAIGILALTIFVIVTIFERVV